MPGPKVDEGDRVEVVRWAPSPHVNDNETVPPGTQGTVQAYYPSVDQVWVAWDNGSNLCLVMSVDQWRVPGG